MSIVSTSGSNKDTEDRHCTKCKKFLPWSKFYKKHNGHSCKMAEFEKMLQSQDNKCAICKTSFEEIEPNIDHCYETGTVRGLLCKYCNQGIGFLKDDKSILRQAIEYLS